MNVGEIKAAVEAGHTVCWSNPSYEVVKDSIGQWLIKHANGHCIGLTWRDGVTLNGNEEDFFATPKAEQIYYSRNGVGELITLKGAQTTDTPNVWAFGGISRHIKDLSTTVEWAVQFITYGMSKEAIARQQAKPELYTIKGTRSGIPATIHCCYDTTTGDTHFAIHEGTEIMVTVGKLTEGVNIDTLIMDSSTSEKVILCPAEI
jgi:hypothetical protein